MSVLLFMPQMYIYVCALTFPIKVKSHKRLECTLESRLNNKGGVSVSFCDIPTAVVVCTIYRILNWGHG